MIIQLKQGYVDRRSKKPVHLQAGLITASLPLAVMMDLVKAGHAKKVGDRRTGKERREEHKAAVKDAPAAAATEYVIPIKKVVNGKTITLPPEDPKPEGGIVAVATDKGKTKKKD